MSKTKIEWAEKVWNPVTGCNKVSEGCRNCYAERYWHRFHKDVKFSQVQLHPGKLEEPLHWNKPARIFVDSMGDLFHKDVPLTYIVKVFAIMAIARWHTFIILTKRPERMCAWLSDENFPEYIAKAQEDICGQHGWCADTDFDWPLLNVWLGVSVEDQKTADERIHWLLKTPVAVRIVSVEPMLEKINISPYLYGNVGRYYGDHPNYLNWVICGCESGAGARPMKLSWAADLKHQCVFNDVPFFFKQAMINGKLVKMPALDGKVWDEYPGDHDQK